MTEPRTAAGRKLLDDWWPPKSRGPGGDEWRPQVSREIAAIEAEARAAAPDLLESWLANPDWPVFGPGVGHGPLDPGRMGARAAIQQAIDALREDADAS